VPGFVIKLSAEKSGNRNRGNEMAGQIVQPKRPRKILWFWIYESAPFDTMDNETA